jgi:Flp pilus assembly protein TadD
VKLAALAVACALAGFGASCASDDASRADDFESADPSRPPSVETLRSMARLFAAQGRDEECERTLERLIEDHPNCAPAYNDLAELHMRLGRTSEAKAALEAGLEHAPADSVLLNNLGLCELRRGAPERALERFTAAVASSPTDARCRGNMALAMGLCGRMDEALALYLQVVPEAEAHENLAIVLESRGDLTGAAKERMLAAESRTRAGNR